MQDEVARMLLAFARIEYPPIPLTSEEEADVAEADAKIARGGLATDEKSPSDAGEVWPLRLRFTKRAMAEIAPRVIGSPPDPRKRGLGCRPAKRRRHATVFDEKRSPSEKPQNYSAPIPAMRLRNMSE
jgi:hypothetical protein